MKKSVLIIVGSLCIGVGAASAQTDTTNTRRTGTQQSNQYRVEQGAGTTKGTGTKTGTYGTQGAQGSQATEGTQGTSVEKNRTNQNSRMGSQGTGAQGTGTQGTNSEVRTQDTTSYRRGATNTTGTSGSGNASDSLIQRRNKKQ